MNAINEFVAGTGALMLVRGSVVPNGYESLDFVFVHGVLKLRADDDTDELSIDLVRAAEPGFEHLGQSADFAPALGKIIDHAWWMTNHRGYSDAF